jgi:hypothetical protein
VNGDLSGSPCPGASDFATVVPTMAFGMHVGPLPRGVVGDANVVQIPPALGYDDVSVFVRAFGGAYLNVGTQDTRLDR